VKTQVLETDVRIGTLDAVPLKVCIRVIKEAEYKGDNRARAFIDIRDVDLGEEPGKDQAGPDYAAAVEAFSAKRLKAQYQRLADATGELEAFLQGGLSATTWNYDPMAGCTMCLCSPGLIADRELIYEGQPAQIWIDPILED
jgi:hypothetical protein